MLSQESLLQEITGTFQAELHEHLAGQAYIRRGQKMAIPVEPDLDRVIRRQVLFAWSLGYAVGSSSSTGKNRQ